MKEFSRDLQKSIDCINAKNILLVFPVKNAKEPASLWGSLHPRTPMKWEWDDSGDNRVFEMWSRMKHLSSCREVVYSKWYMGRATFFSRNLFVAMLRLLGTSQQNGVGLSKTARLLLSELESDSPLSTKQLKLLTDLRGRDNESIYNRAMKELFHRLHIVAFGEVEDGAFPSLAVGATQLIYEDLWIESLKISKSSAQTLVDTAMPEGSQFRNFFDRISKSLPDT